MDAGVFRELYQAFLRYQVLLFPPQDLPPAQSSGLRAPLRRGAGACHEPVPRRRLPRALPSVEPRREWQAERPSPGQGHAGLAHRRLLAARDRAGDDHLRRGHAGRRRRDAFLRHVRRLRAPRRGVEGAHRQSARRAQPGFFPQPAPWRGSADRSAAAGEAAGGPSGCAHASRNGAQMPVPRRSRGIHRRPALRRRPRADRGTERARHAPRPQLRAPLEDRANSSCGTTAA